MSQIESYAGAVNATECIGNGWNLIKQNYWMFFGIAVVGFLILFVLGCIPLISRPLRIQLNSIELSKGTSYLSLPLPQIA